MSKKRKTREQKLHAQEKRLNSSLITDREPIAPHTYSIAIDPISESNIVSYPTQKGPTTHTSPYVLRDLYKSIITASGILVLSALLSLVVKRTDFLSLILN